MEIPAGESRQTGFAEKIVVINTEEAFFVK